MMNKLSTQGTNQNRPFKPKSYQGRRREQGRNNYYDKGKQWDRYGSSVVIDMEDKIIEIDLS